MTSSQTLKALFKLNTTSERVTNVKRLALLFDELLYMLPDTHPVLNGTPLENGQIRVQQPDGTFVNEDFDFFAHTSDGFTFDESSIHDAELQETLAELREAEIAVPVSITEFHDLSTAQYRRVRAALAATESLDEEFNRISETSAEQYESVKIKPLRTIDKDGNEHEDWLVRAPNAVVDSYDITDVLAYSNLADACPVFIDPHHQAEVRHRHERLSAIAGVVSRTLPGVGAFPSVRPAFGSVAFSFASQVFSRETIDKKTTSQIIKYRRAMTTSRELLMSGDLLALVQLSESAPWSDKIEADVERYLIGKFKNDLALYNQKMRETWEKMFGSLAVGAMTAVKTGGGGGILGYLLPHSSFWEMAVLGSVAGLMKESPNLAKAIVESVLAVRAQRRTGIAYFAEFD